MFPKEMLESGEERQKAPSSSTPRPHMPVENKAQFLPRIYFNVVISRSRLSS